MKYIKSLKAKENEEVVKQRLEELARLLDEEGSISYGEINYLQDHQEEIKKYFPNNSTMWQWAGIPEEEWNNKKSSLADDTASKIGLVQYDKLGECLTKLQIASACVRRLKEMGVISENSYGNAITVLEDLCSLTHSAMIDLDNKHHIQKKFVNLDGE